MLFKDLYDIVVAETHEPPVRFERLRAIINERHAGVGEVKVWAIKYAEPNNQAHYRMIGTDRSSAYEEEFILAEIRYCEALDHDEAERRYALTKELMHVFDNEDEMTNTREKFIRLVKDIQNQPLPQHASKPYLADLSTRWMAVIILCPKPIRGKYLERYKKKEIADFEIASDLRLPTWIISFLMDDYYDEVFDELMAKR